jgi:hypothetical protein
MKKKIGVVVFLLLCGLIISAAIYAGEKQHSDCRECRLAIGKK